MKRRVIVGLFLALLLLLGLPVVLGLWVSSEDSAASASPATNKPRIVTKWDSKPGGGEARAPAEVLPLPIQADVEPRGPLRLQGQVIDAGELPVDGALVFLDTRPPVSMRTERDGTFVFTGLAPRVYQLEARRGNTHAGPVAVALHETTEPVILRVRPAASVLVTVLDARSRQPLAQASVELRGSTVVSALTDARGQTELQGLPAGPSVVMASAPGHAPLYKSLPVADSEGAPQKVTLELVTGASASGTVVDGQGRPVPQARVVAEPASSLVTLVDAQRDAVQTDASGRWLIPALAAGSYRFVATGSAQAPSTSALVTLDGARPQEGIVITLQDSARLAGRVVSRTGEPVGFATVRAVVDEGTWGQTLARQTLADAAGLFSLEGLPRRRLHVVALHEDSTSSTQTVDLSREPVREDLLLALDADALIGGTVVSSSGVAVPEAVVQAEPAALASRSRTEATLRGPLSTVTDSAGHFELRGLRPGSYLLRTAPPGTSLQRSFSWMRPALKVDAGRRDVKLTLQEDGAMKGVVRRQDGAPVESFSLSLGISPARGVFSDASGRFLLSGIAPGTYAVTLTSPSFMTQAVQNVTIRPGQTTDLGTIEVQPGRRISGRVVNKEGAPVPGAVITASKQVSGVVAGPAGALVADVKQATAGEDGSFTLEGLGSRPVVIGAEHPSQGRSVSKSLPEGTASVQLEFVLSAVGSIKGAVTRGGEPVGGAVVVASSKGAPSGGSGVNTGTDGSYQFDALVPGPYTLVAMFDNGSGQQIKQATVEVGAGATARQDFELPRGDVTLVVQAAPLTGQEAGSTEAQVFVADTRSASSTSSPPPNVRSQVLTRSEPARFPELSPGSYQLCVVGKPLPGSGSQPQGKGGPPPCRFIAVGERPTEQQVTVDMP